MMLNTSRRTALLTIAAAGAAAPLLMAVQRASAQTAPAEGGDQSDYVVQTLTVGSVALQTSQIAAEKASDPMVQEFAGLEVGEQQAIASVLASTEAGRTPPELPAEEAAKIEELNGMEAGPEFDAAYIQGQIDGHNRLLEIQQMLSGETVATVEAVTAKLAEQAVTSHLAMLNHIQAQLGQGDGQQEAQG
jgi:putative membrane protein